MTIQEMLRFVSDAGVIGLLIVAVVGGYKRWYIWGWLYSEKEKECNELKRMLYSQVGLTDRATRVAEKLVQGTNGGS